MFLIILKKNIPLTISLSGLQKMELPYLSDSFRKKVLEYKLVDNLSKSRDTLLTEATVEYMNIYYNMDHMPNFCKQNLVLNMKLSVNSFLQVRLSLDSLYLTVRYYRILTVLLQFYYFPHFPLNRGIFLFTCYLCTCGNEKTLAQ